MSYLYRGRHLHSAYAPEKEAKRWVESLNQDDHQAIFLIGDALGYAQKALQENLTHRVWSLLPEAKARNFRLPLKGETWAPEDGPLEQFLALALEESGVERVFLEVWPAFERLNSYAVLSWSQEFRRVFRQFQGSRLTEQHFGFAFWKNTLRNLSDWKSSLVVERGTKGIVIAASGPSLERCRKWMKSRRSRFHLWALPSSFEALQAWGLDPDAGVATDAGYYARAHLEHLTKKIPLISAVNGAPDPYQDRPKVFFGQGSVYERLFLGLFHQNFFEIPSQGTVAVSAILLALSLTKGPVLVAGLDLGCDRLRFHVSPHTIESSMRPTCTRLNPWDSLMAQNGLEQGCVRHQGQRTSKAMLTYALWLDSKDRFPYPVYRVEPTALRWKSMQNLGFDEADRLLQPGLPLCFKSCSTLPRKERIARLLTALRSCQHQIQTKSLSSKDLMALARTTAASELGQWQKIHRSSAKHSGQAWNAVEKKTVEFLGSLLGFMEGLA